VKNLLMKTTAVVLSLAMPGIALTQTTASTTPAATTWGHWGAAPYATSFADMCRKMPAGIDGMDMPDEVKARFKARTGPKCEGGTEVWLTPNQRLNQMWTGGRNPHPMMNVTVGELPVTRSPDGRTYRAGAVAQAAKALEWTEEYNGLVYHLVVPFECFNVSWFTTPSAPVESCDLIRVHTEATRALRFAFYRPYKPSGCFAMKTPGSTEWQPLPNRCPDTNCDFREVSRVLGSEPIQSGGVAPVQDGVYEFRVPREFASNPANVAVFCLEQLNGQHSQGVGITKETEDYHADGSGQSVAEIFFEGRQPAGYRYHVIHWRLGG